MDSRRRDDENIISGMLLRYQRRYDSGGSVGSGADEQVLRHALASLPVKGFDIKISRVKKSGLDVCDFDVLLDEEHENHDHDMVYLHGDDHMEHVHTHTHGVVENICIRTLIAV